MHRRCFRQSSAIASMQILAVVILVISGMSAVVTAAKEVPDATVSRPSKETAVPHKEEKRFDKAYGFGLGKKSIGDVAEDNVSYYDGPYIEHEHGDHLQSATNAIHDPSGIVSVDKRDPRYAFGLGKRNLDTDGGMRYSFGLGKRFSDDSRFSFGLGKRERDDNRFSFGLGKRSNDMMYSFGLGKRPDENRFSFGLGKRDEEKGRYSFGLGKRSDEKDRYSFGLGKRSDERGRYGFGLGKRSDENDRYSFGLGKRSDERDRYGFGLGKRDVMDTRYGFGLGKRETDEYVSDRKGTGCANYQEKRDGSQRDRFNFGLGKRIGENRFGFGLGKRLPDDSDFDDFIKRRYSFGLGKRSQKLDSENSEKQR